MLTFISATILQSQQDILIEDYYFLLQFPPTKSLDLASRQRLQIQHKGNLLQQTYAETGHITESQWLIISCFKKIAALPATVPDNMSEKVYYGLQKSTSSLFHF